MANADTVYHVKKPNTTQRTTDVISSCTDYLVNNFGANWIEAVIRIPALMKCDWEGPLNYASGSSLTVPIANNAQTLHNFQSGLLKKYETEFAVFQAFYQSFSKSNKAAMLVHSPPLTAQHLRMINQTFAITLNDGNPMAKKQDGKADTIKTNVNWSAELTDILIVAPTIGVIIVEVKPSLTEWDKAHKELNYAESWIRTLLAALDMPTVPVIKCLALPITPNVDLKEMHRDVMYIAKEEIDSFESWFERQFTKDTGGFVMGIQWYKDLLTVSVVLKTAVFNCDKASSKVIADLKYVSVHEAAITALNSLTTEAYLKSTFKKQKSTKSNKDSHSRIVRVAPKCDNTGVFNQVMFLTPEQALIWDNPVLKQVIDGYASTGKTMLVQNKVVHLLMHDNRDVIVIVPPSLLQLYRQFFKLSFGLRFNDLILSRRLTICGLCEFATIDIEKVGSSHVFRDEFGATYCLCDSSTLTAAVDRLLLAMTSSDCHCWTTSDSSQTSIKFKKFLDGQEGPAYLVNRLEELENSMSPGIYGYMTSALRCTVQIYSEWKIHLGSQLLQQGHNVVGPPVRKISLSPAQYKADVIVKELKAEVRSLLSDRWDLCDLAILILDYDGDQQLKAEIERHIGYPVCTTFDRFGVDGACLTVDLTTNTFSHEWPVVITVHCPDSPYDSGNMKYVAQSRCLVQLITVGCNNECYNIGSVALHLSAEKVCLSGTVYANALATIVRRSIEELGTFITIQYKAVGSGDLSAHRYTHENLGKHAHGIIDDIKSYLKFAKESSEVLLDLYGDTEDRHYLNLLYLIMREFYRCAYDCQRNDIDSICGNLVAEECGESVRALLKLEGDFDSMWQTHWEAVISLKLPLL